MSVVAVNGIADVRQSHFTSFDLPVEGAELAPNELGGMRVHLQNHLTLRGDDELGLQPPVEIGRRNYPGLLPVEPQSQMPCDLFQPEHTFTFQVVQVFVNGIAVIHVPGISFNSQDFFEIVVNRTRQQQSVCLADLTAQAEAHGAEVCDKAVVQFPNTVIVEPPFRFPQQRGMGSVIEEALEVVYQDAAAQAVFAEVSFQVIDHAPQSEVHSPVFQAGGIVVDERGGVDRNNAVVT